VSWPVDIADYLLGELDADDRAVAERLLREDASFRAEVERLRPLIARLEALPREAWEPEAPPPAPGIRAPRSHPSRRLVLRPLVAAAASLLLLAAGLGIGLLVADGGGGSARGRTYALAPLGDAPRSAAAVATVTPGDRVLTLEVAGLPPSPEGSFYELWLLNSPTDLVSLGSFRLPASGHATLSVPLPTAPERFRFLDISVEPVDGDPAHSGASVLRGQTA
jgi:anti-sigma-K factor RskA